MPNKILVFGLAMLMILSASLVPLSISGTASAHVHGVTPLSQCTVDNPNSGGNGTNGTPADDANGGPIAGVIPITVGNSPLSVGDGGFGATAGHCP